MKLRKLIILLMTFVTVNGFCEVDDTMLKKAQQGNVEIQLEVARQYLNGDYPQDAEKGLYWLEKAANQNNTEAMVTYAGILCDKDLDYIEPNFIKAMELYRKAAAKGNKRAKEVLTDLSNLKKREISHECPFEYLPCDDEVEEYPFFKENESLIRKEYEKKNPVAAYYLAIIAYEEKDYKKTVELLTEIYPLVIDENNSFEDLFENEEQYSFRTRTIGIRVPSLLGCCYEFGLGVSKDYKKAAEYYLTDFGYTDFGMSMIPQVRAAFCYKKAGLIDKFEKEADTQGILIGNGKNDRLLKVPCLQNELAEMYRTGDGVPLNKKKALEIYEAVVDTRKYIKDINFWLPEIRSYEDIGNAAYQASKMYKNGEGCEKDPTMEELYFEIALKYGNVNAWYESK